MPGIKPREKVKRVWSPKMAYAIGLLATDGSLSNDGRHINFTSKDLDQIENFRRCLGLENKIGKKSRSSEREKKYYQVQFGDVVFYNWLLTLGLSPNKSKTIGKLDIPDQYFFDFLRGCFDGDGCINAYWDRRWHSSYMFYIRFASGSLKFLEWLRQNIHRLSGASGRIRSNDRQHELVFAKKAARTIFSKMFYSEKTPCLKRKLLKAKEIFEIDNYHNNAQVVELVDTQI